MVSRASALFADRDRTTSALPMPVSGVTVNQSAASLSFLIISQLQLALRETVKSDDIDGAAIWVLSALMDAFGNSTLLLAHQHL